MPDEKDWRDHRAENDVPVDAPTQLVQLPYKTRLWLADKREADLKLIDEMIEIQRTARSLGRVSKWLFFALIAMFITLGEIGQAFNRLISFVTGGKLGGG